MHKINLLAGASVIPYFWVEIRFALETTEISAKNTTDASVSLYQSDFYRDIHTKLLDRDVLVEVMRPAIWIPDKKYPLLVLNDGQDSEAVKIKQAVEHLVREGKIEDIIVAGVTAGDRMQEYGVCTRPDFKNRGSKARAYSKFITTELFPYLVYRYPIDPSPVHHAIAGYSLGGLSAMDIAFNHPEIFQKTGAFSGSFWWRKRDTASRFYSDYRDRIMHQQIRRGKFKPGLKFWFQTGTRDETSDRNKNGVIDSIDDTLDLIVELTHKGYKPFRDIHYLEIEGGEHNPQTWAQAMPEFLVWAFGR
jgi:enterochelin esterase-like enzyme